MATDPGLEVTQDDRSVTVTSRAVTDPVQVTIAGMLLLALVASIYGPLWKALIVALFLMAAAWWWLARPAITSRFLLDLRRVTVESRSFIASTRAVYHFDDVLVVDVTRGTLSRLALRLKDGRQIMLSSHNNSPAMLQEAAWQICAATGLKTAGDDVVSDRGHKPIVIEAGGFRLRIEGRSCALEPLGSVAHGRSHPHALFDVGARTLALAAGGRGDQVVRVIAFGDIDAIGLEERYDAEEGSSWRVVVRPSAGELIRIGRWNAGDYHDVDFLLRQLVQLTGLARRDDLTGPRP